MTGSDASNNPPAPSNNPPAPPETQLKKYEILIALAGTAGTIFGSGIYTIIQFPIVDYLVTTNHNADSTGIETFDIIIKNLGTTAAKNVLVSVYVTNATIKSFVPTPYQPDNFNATKISYGNAYAKINILPSHAEVKMTTIVDTTKSSGTEMIITPYVFSDEGVGRFNQSASIFFYILLIIIIIILLTGLGQSGIENVTRRNLGVGVGIILGYIGVFYLAYMIIYAGWTIHFPSIHFPSIHFPSINISSLPPVKTLVQVYH